MATSFGALCNDFYVNLTIALKMDLPCERESIMGLFDRVRKVRPTMDKFRRYDDELTLESNRREAMYTWLALRQNSIRTGHVNPDSMEDAWSYHRSILETVPYYLSVSALDIDYVEVLFGFDLECDGNHDEVVYEALYADSAVGDLMKEPLLAGDDAVDANSQGGKIIDVQPMFRFALSDDGETQGLFEVKTRERSRRGNASRSRDEPISLFVAVRRFGPVPNVDDLSPWMQQLGVACETLTTDRLIPHLLTPIARQITSSNA